MRYYDQQIIQLLWDSFLFHEDSPETSVKGELLEHLGLTRIPQCVFCIGIDHFSSLPGLQQKSARENTKKAALDTLGSQEAYLIASHRNFLYLNFYLDEFDQDDPGQELEDLATAMRQQAKKTQSISLSIGIEFSYSPTPETWRHTALEAIAAQRQKFFLGNDRTYFASKLTRTPSPTDYPHLQKRFLNLLGGPEPDQILSAGERLLKEVFHAYGSRVFSLRLRLTELLVLIARRVVDLGVPESTAFSRLVGDTEKINKHYDITDLFWEVSSSLEKFIRLVDSDRNTFSPPVKAALYLINNSNLSELSLRDVAASTGTEYTYLSRIFRQQVGKTFSEYLNEVRVQKAQKCLLDPSKSITDTAFEAGFKDIRHLERILKKTCGLTPRQFRKEHS